MEKRPGASQRAGFSTMAAMDDLPRGTSLARNPQYENALVRNE